MAHALPPLASRLLARLGLVALLAAAPAPGFAAGGRGAGMGGRAGGMGGGMGRHWGGMHGESFRVRAPRGTMPLVGLARAPARTDDPRGFGRLAAATGFGEDRGFGDARADAGFGEARGSFGGLRGAAFGGREVRGRNREARRELRRLALRELRLRTSRCDRNLAERYNEPFSCNDSPTYGYYPR